MEINSNTYEEVYEILSHMDKITVMKIPEDILNHIKNKRNKKFISRIDKNDLFNQDNVSKETIDILCWLDINYWMEFSKKKTLEEKYRKITMQEEMKNVIL